MAINSRRINNINSTQMQQETLAWLNIGYITTNSKDEKVFISIGGIPITPSMRIVPSNSDKETKAIVEILKEKLLDKVDSLVPGEHELLDNLKVRITVPSDTDELAEIKSEIENDIVL